MARVALINMPFAPADRPSIQCGLLAGALLRRGHSAEVFDFNLELAAGLGADVYAGLAGQRSDSHVGDWLFSAAAFGEVGDEDQYRKECPDIEQVCARLGHDFDSLRTLRRDMIATFIRRCVDEVDWGAFQLVGFTSTFEQQVASLALARAIKAQAPSVTVVFGGANVTGEMGVEFLRAFSWLDVVVLGEGDEVLPALVETLNEAMTSWPLPGTACRIVDEVRVGPPAPLVVLDGLADPEYGAYFQRLTHLGKARVLGKGSPQIPFEGSRGCWWGEKSPCSFCGLNGPSAQFRRKGPERLRGELLRLASLHHQLDFEAVDRILDPTTIDALFGLFAAGSEDFSFFYEVKSSLNREQLGRLVRAGVYEIQPGIESLSTRLLRLMHKGTNLLENVRCLGWAKYHGLLVGWNILTGIPGETPEDYAAQAEIVPLLHHLPPPRHCGRIWLDRFSPYGTDPSFPFRNRRPRAAYRFIYPEGKVDLTRIAYFWDYELDGAVPEEGTALLRERVARWQELWRAAEPPRLEARQGAGWLLIDDQREPEAPREVVLKGLEADLYSRCSESQSTVGQLAARLAAGGFAVEVPWVAACLERWCEQGLVLADGDRFLSLALPRWRADRDMT